jgi:hypothetical protein
MAAEAEVGSMGAAVAEAVSMEAASVAADIRVSAVAGGRMAAERIGAEADSRRAPMAGLRIEARWALDRLQVHSRARGLVRAWADGVSVTRDDRPEPAMPLRTADGIRLEAPAG